MTDSKQVTPVGKKRPPAAGMGRKKGTPNKVTKQLKEMILGALDSAGGQKYLEDQAKKNPQAFMTLLGKVLPSEMKAEVSGPGGTPIMSPPVFNLTVKGK